jgi:glutaredoxin-like YruB-family protein
MKNVNSHKELIEALKSTEKAYCLLYKKGSELSNCAYEAIEKGLIENVEVFVADINTIKDIHSEYDVTSVPTLLSFEDGEFKNLTKGCNGKEYYKSLFSENIYTASTNNEEKPQNRVTVYSTPTCTYCNQIKKYFDEKSVKYRDIDVSKDQKAAKKMVKRSGQQGVPQTDINGQIVIGFDRIKINKLLNIE